jgi:hypothetical protein
MAGRGSVMLNDYRESWRGLVPAIYVSLAEGGTTDVDVHDKRGHDHEETIRCHLMGTVRQLAIHQSGSEAQRSK